MNDLNAIISTFSTENKKHFSLYLEKKNKRKDTKNSQLFRLLLKGDLSSKQICLKIYKSDKKEAYYALRKRLFQSIIDFIANTDMMQENSVDMQLIKYVIVSRNFLKHNKHKVAYKILDKAELLAHEHQLFSILNEIYYTKIQFAHKNPLIDLPSLIEKYESNLENFKLHNQLNLVYAKIRHLLKNRKHKENVIDYQLILEKAFHEQNISITKSMTFQSLYQLMTIVSISAFVSNDYLKIESYLIHTYKLLEDHKTKEKQLYFHIQVLYLIANTLFMNKKFDLSIQYLNKMYVLMLSNNKKYFSTIILKYNLLMGLNLNYSNKQDEAITLLESYKLTKHKDKESLLYIYLSLIMFYMQKNEFNRSFSILSQFYHTDKWYIDKIGMEWTIKKNIIEIILHIELQNIDLVESRLLSFKRNYYPYLRQINQERVITYLSLVELYYKNPEEVSTLQFKEKVEASFEWLERKREDIFVMSFYAWLKSKMEKRSIYATTLDLVKLNQDTLEN